MAAPTPVLNNTAPQVNLWDVIGHANFGTHTTAQGVVSAPVSTPTLDLSGIIPVFFTLLFIVWIIYSLVVIYHWFRYRHQSWFAVPMLVLHFFVSGTIIVYMISGLA